VLITPALAGAFRRIEPIRINTDYPVSWTQALDTSRRSSDHDPVLVRFRIER